jgi:hypothetical protein
MTALPGRLWVRHTRASCPTTIRDRGVVSYRLFTCCLLGEHPVSPTRFSHPYHLSAIISFFLPPFTSHSFSTDDCHVYQRLICWTAKGGSLSCSATCEYLTPAFPTAPQACERACLGCARHRHVFAIGSSRANRLLMPRH